MSLGGRLPSGAEIREGGHPGETQGAGLEDLAYKGLGDVIPPNSRVDSTTPRACYALRAFNGCCKQFHFIPFSGSPRPFISLMSLLSDFRPHRSLIRRFFFRAVHRAAKTWCTPVHPATSNRSTVFNRN